MAKKSSTPETKKTETELINEMVDYSVSAVIQEAVTHFNKTKRCVRSLEDDCRFFWNDTELNSFLRQIEFPDKIWVSTVYDGDGKFYAYRVGRIIKNKKRGVVKC